MRGIIIKLCFYKKRRGSKAFDTERTFISANMTRMCTFQKRFRFREKKKVRWRMRTQGGWISDMVKRSISYSALCFSDFILALTVWKSDKLSWECGQKINWISVIYIYYGSVVCQALYGTYILHDNVLFPPEGSILILYLHTTPLMWITINTFINCSYN